MNGPQMRMNNTGLLNSRNVNIHQNQLMNGPQMRMNNTGLNSQALLNA